MDSRLRGNDGFVGCAGMRYWIPACAGMTAGGVAVAGEYPLRGNDGFVGCAGMRYWIPACAGMTAGGVVVTREYPVRGNGGFVGRAGCATGSRRAPG